MRRLIVSRSIFSIFCLRFTIKQVTLLTVCFWLIFQLYIICQHLNLLFQLLILLRQHFYLIISISAEIKLVNLRKTLISGLLVLELFLRSLMLLFLYLFDLICEF